MKIYRQVRARLGRGHHYYILRSILHTVVLLQQQQYCTYRALYVCTVLYAVCISCMVDSTARQIFGLQINISLALTNWADLEDTLSSRAFECAYLLHDGQQNTARVVAACSRSIQRTHFTTQNWQFLDNYSDARKINADIESCLTGHRSGAGKAAATRERSSVTSTYKNRAIASSGWSRAIMVYQQRRATNSYLHFPAPLVEVEGAFWAFLFFTSAP